MALSNRENERIAAEETYNQKMAHLFAVDSLFVHGISDSLKKVYYQRELEQRTSYKLNRSKWDIKRYANNILQDSSSREGDYFSVDCNCTLHDNRLQVFIGTWVFGGTFLIIDIAKDTFNATFIEDAHQLYPFKYTLQDSILTNEIKLNLDNTHLTLTDTPTFELDNVTKGMLEFETPIYYIDTHYLQGFEPIKGEQMNAIVVKGRIYFICESKDVNFR